MSAAFSARMNESPRACAAPAARADWALFLDIDGTLIDIAPRPEDVVVPKSLPSLLTRASIWLGGAVALISGRPIAQIDALVSPLVLPCAGEHGAVLRLPDGTIETADSRGAIPAHWRAQLIEATQEWRGVIVEPKSFSIAVHYRLAPERRDDVWTLVQRVVAQNPRDYEILAARKAFEIRNRAVSKAKPVLRLMPLSPFSGRTPVFIGDDVTDQDGFRAVLAIHGIALDVHEVFNGRPADVLAWLDRYVPAQP